MKIYCACPNPDEALVMAGSPFNPCYTVEWQGEIVQRHYACAVQSMKDRLGCPCDCHSGSNINARTGESVVLAWCSFCPSDQHADIK